MTPEERAKMVVGFATNCGTDGLEDVALYHIRAAEEAARAEERERCAMVVADGEWEEGADLPETLANIAAAIRKGE